MRIEDLFKLGMDRDPGTLKPMMSGFILNVGAGNKIIPGTQGLDYPDWDADGMPIPFEDDIVAGIHCYHFLEHCREPVKVLLEFQRVLERGGLVNICVPYYNSQLQAQDLDHKCCFTEDTWRILFKNPYYNKNRIDWKFSVNFNMICGVAERNLCLLTQLEKVF